MLNDQLTPNWCKNIFNYFIRLDNIDIDSNSKNIIDLLFGIIYTTAPLNIEDVKKNYINDKFYDEIIKNNNLFDYLVIVSKILIKEEFDFALKSVTPTYNTDTMKPDWKLPSLLSAFYFSIFYRDSKSMIYKRCANSGCGMLFEVSNTNSKKKYCSQLCAANTNQRIYRQKKKQGI